MKLFAVIFFILTVVLSIAGIGLLTAFPIMWCWNHAVVPIWDLRTITWTQAWCLNFLAGVLIKSTLVGNK